MSNPLFNKFKKFFTPQSPDVDDEDSIASLLQKNSVVPFNGDAPVASEFQRKLSLLPSVQPAETGVDGEFGRPRRILPPLPVTEQPVGTTGGMNDVGTSPQPKLNMLRALHLATPDTSDADNPSELQDAEVFPRPLTPLPAKLPPNTVSLGEGSTYEPVRFDERQERGINEQGRPRVADPLSYAEKRLEERMIEPAPHISRGRAILAGLGRGALAGAPYGLGGIVGGAATGAITGGVSPNKLATLKHDESVQRDADQVGNLFGLRGASQKLAQQQAQTEATQANTDFTRSIKPLQARSVIAKNEASIRQGDRRLDITQQNNVTRQRISKDAADNLAEYRRQLNEQSKARGLREDQRIELESKRIEEMIANNKADNERAERQLTETGRHNRSTEGTAQMNAETSRKRQKNDADNAGLASELDDLATQADQRAQELLDRKDANGDANPDTIGAQTFQRQASTIRQKAAVARSKSKGGQSADTDPLGIRN